MPDWKHITDDREKYAAYLCSREWSVLKEAVHARAEGKCERCRLLPINAVHHLTYARKYAERLEDLQAICTPCHEFTHGKHSCDPESSELLHWLIRRDPHGKPPVPLDILLGLILPDDLVSPFGEYLRVVWVCEAAEWHRAASVVAEQLPFDLGIDTMPPGYLAQLAQELLPGDIPAGAYLYRIAGWSGGYGQQWMIQQG